MKHLMFYSWFQQQEEFNSTIEEMTPQQLNKCLQKFYLSARRQDGTFYNKNRLPLFIQRMIGILSQLS